MILKQYVLGCLSHASYLVGDEASRTAAVVDPQRDVDGYVEDAARLGLTIRHVLLTHFHADFVSGHLELAERCGARIHLGQAARAAYDFEPARHGEWIELGPSVRIQVLATPGHTPELTCYAVHDRAQAAAGPRAVFTGDTLFVGDVGRPDLMASTGTTAEALAGQLYDSLRDVLLPLPDETVIYPAHTAGSMCGKNLSSEPCSTLGAQRRSNPALRPTSRADFVRALCADQPEAPAYFAFDAELNKSRRETLSRALERELVPLALERTLELAADGAVLLDVRDPAEFARGHLAGSVNIGLSGRYASWCGTLLPRERPIVLIAPSGRAREAALRLGRIGYDRVAGHLAGGADAFAARPDLVRSHLRVEVADLARHLSAEGAPLVIDVRAPSEWEHSRIPGSRNVPLNRLEASLAELPRGRALALHCQTGYRSSIAASLLARHGFGPLLDLEGGIVAWQQAGLPTRVEIAAT